MQILKKSKNVRTFHYHGYRRIFTGFCSNFLHRWQTNIHSNHNIILVFRSILVSSRSESLQQRHIKYILKT